MYGLYGMSGPYIVLMYGSNPYILASVYGLKILDHKKETK